MVKIAFDEPETPSQSDAPSVRISDIAASRIEKLLSDEPEGSVLRITITGGGCSGYSYNFKLDSTQNQTDKDIVVENGAAKVLIDADSFGFIKGSTIDYTDTLEASQFIIKNPNAKTSCGCGTSFSL